MYHNFLTYLSADGHLDGLHDPAIRNNAALNIGVHVSFSIMLSCSEIAGSHDSFIPELLFF